jgi:hypothetical protein
MMMEKTWEGTGYICKKNIAGKLQRAYCMFISSENWCKKYNINPSDHDECQDGASVDSRA